MRKIRLDVEELAVESFATARDGEKKSGTVHGNEYSEWEGCVVSGASDCATCDRGCPQDTVTCFASCQMTDGLYVCFCM